MEAMDLLLMACHAQTLNLFVESFLKMIQKLLEDSNPSLQIMATNSVSIFFTFCRYIGDGNESCCYALNLLYLM